MGWMSAGRAANTGLLRERERMPGKMAPPLRRTQAAAGSTVKWNFLWKSMPRMGPSTFPVMKSNLHRLVVLQAKNEGPLGTSGNGCTSSSGEQAALWSSWTRYQGHGSPGVGQEESACGVIFEEDQVSQADGVDTTRGA